MELFSQIPLPQEPSEVRRMERKSRKAAKLQERKIGTVPSTIDEQKSQLLPSNIGRYEMEIFVV